MTTCRYQHKRLVESVWWIGQNFVANKYAGLGWSKKTSRDLRQNMKGSRLNISFIGATFTWTRWRNHKRALYFASSDDSLLKFTDIRELIGLAQQELPTLRGGRPRCESQK